MVLERQLYLNANVEKISMTEINVYAVVETRRGTSAKFEFDPKLKAFTLAKPLLAGRTYS